MRRPYVSSLLLGEQCLGTESSVYFKKAIRERVFSAGPFLLQFVHSYVHVWDFLLVLPSQLE